MIVAPPFNEGLFGFKKGDGTKEADESIMFAFAVVLLERLRCFLDGNVGVVVDARRV